jgi:hypothetical protein
VPLCDGRGVRGGAQSTARMVVAAVALVCGGCRLSVAVDVDVDSGGGGELAVVVGADTDLLGRAAAAGARPLEDVEKVGRQLAPDGWRTTVQATEDGGRRVTIVTRFEDPHELEALTTDLADALAAPELRPLEPLRLEMTSGRVALDGEASLVFSDAVAEQGVTADEAARLVGDVVDYQVRVTLPGEVLETSAPRRDGATLVWPVPAGEEVRVLAVGERPRPLPGVLLVPAAAVALLALLVCRHTGVWRVRRSQRDQVDTAPEGSD